MVTSEKGNFANEEKKQIIGGSIDKAERMKKSSNRNKVPSPTKYFKRKEENPN